MAFPKSSSQPTKESQELDIRARHQGNQQAIGGGDGQLALGRKRCNRCGSDPSGEQMFLLSSQLQLMNLSGSNSIAVY